MNIFNPTGKKIVDILIWTVVFFAIIAGILYAVGSITFTFDQNDLMYIGIAVVVGFLYLIYSFYKLLQKPTGEKVSKKTTIISCPSPATLVDYIKGKKKGKQKQELYNHIANCKDCQYAVKSMFDMPTEELKKKKAPK